VGADKRKRTTVSILWQTKDRLESIKHPGQSYEGLIQELIKLWEREHGIAESGQASAERG